VRFLAENRRSESPTRRDNILWGIREGLILTGIVLVPATVVFALNSSKQDTSDTIRFAKILTGYLAYGAVSGALAGAWRDTLRQKSGAAMFGGLLGAGTLGTLLLLSRVWRTLVFPKSLAALAVAAGAGAVFGATIGWYGWNAFRRHGRV